MSAHTFRSWLPSGCSRDDLRFLLGTISSEPMPDADRLPAPVRTAMVKYLADRRARLRSWYAGALVVACLMLAVVPRPAFPSLGGWVAFLGMLGLASPSFIDTVHKRDVVPTPVQWDAARRHALGRLPAAALCAPGLFECSGRPWLVEQGVDPDMFAALAADSQQTAAELAIAIRLLVAA